jgi:putative acetyltransferase
MDNGLQIRTAKPADAEAIIHVHYEAVHKTASGFYPAEILEAWSAKPGETRYQWMHSLIANGEEIVIVGEIESEILGFGLLTPKVGELRALYVHPDAGRRGIGKQILHALETCAAVLGLLHLRLNASLNAQAFYRSNGYTSLSRGTFRLSAEHEMDCVKMEKHIARSQCRDAD